MLPLAISMGDPAGIGPEIVAKYAADERRDAAFIVVGDVRVLRRAAAVTGVELTIRPIDGPDDLVTHPGVLNVLAETELPDDLAWGRVDAQCGRAAHRYVVKGAELALAGQAAALVTAPINKEALRLAGVPHPGHTEILAELAGAGEVAMMMANDELRVVLVTIHQSLRDAIEGITAEAQGRTLRLTHDALRRSGIDRPRIAVAGLNPHAGENGLMGTEELEIIGPAVEAARAAGIEASGPWPADTVFLRARKGEFDAVVAQYHDQGLIPVKYLGLEQGVNITLGLPFVRASVDHGTAFDIAGKGVADHASLIAACRQARAMTSAPDSRH